MKTIVKRERTNHERGTRADQAKVQYMYIYMQQQTSSLACALDIFTIRQQTLELERLAEQKQKNDENWQRQQHLLLEAEEDRQKMIALEDQKLSDQRARLAAMKREAKIKEVKALDEARERYLEQQQMIRQNEIRKMDEEIQRKVIVHICIFVYMYVYLYMYL